MDTVYRSPNLLLKRRTEIAFLGFMVCFLLLVARLAWLQWWKHAAFDRLARALHVRTIPEPAARGAILDRVGADLAGNVLARDLCANPRVVKDTTATAQSVAELFGGSAEEYRQKLEAEKKLFFVYLKRGIDRELAERVAPELKRRPELKGLELRPAPRRVYPNGALGAAVIGFPNIDGQGQEGIELFYNRTLAGRDGSVTAEVDARGEVIPDSEQKSVAPVDGREVGLTIDTTIQHFADAELQKAVDQYHAEGGTAIVLEVATGEVLALATAPGYDPNEPGKAPAANRRCRAITDIFEPGSIFKPFTVAAGLEEHTDMETYCSGTFTAGGKAIHCAHGHAHGHCDAERLIEQSCNIAAAQVALRLGPEKLYRHLKDFGLMEPAGIELPGEQRGWLSKWETWREGQTARVGFGQAVSVTPLQMARGYAAIANDGVLLKPHLVSEIGGKQVTTKWERRRVMSPDNARLLRGYMERVVTDGTGKSAKIAHYTAAGKTGTAQIAAGGHYVSGAYTASFIGFIPAAQPRLAILVSVRHPVGAQYGGVVAAPVFREIARQMVAYLQVPPDAPDDDRDGAVAGSFEKWKRSHGGVADAHDKASD